ncbi:hypothetical protein NMG60_11002872 [Bertholletia excelsa]
MLPQKLNPRQSSEHANTGARDLKALTQGETDLLGVRQEGADCITDQSSPVRPKNPTESTDGRQRYGSLIDIYARTNFYQQSSPVRSTKPTESTDGRQRYGSLIDIHGQTNFRKQATAVGPKKPTERANGRQRYGSLIDIYNRSNLWCYL